MYIGPWQEYKLARLIQNQQQQIQALQAQSGIAPTPRRLQLHSGHHRRRLIQSERSDDETESTATSSFSTQSAPVVGALHGGSQSGAQRKLEEYYRDEERERRREDKESRKRYRPPRPNSGIRINGRLPSERRDAAVQKKAENFAKARNSRIHGMRALYGLSTGSRPGSSHKNSDGASDASPSPTHSQLVVSPTHFQGPNAVLSPASALAEGSGSSFVMQSEERQSVKKPLWLSQHQSAAEKLQTPNTTSRSTAASSACSIAPVAAVRATRLSPTLEEAFDKIQIGMDFEDDFQDSPIEKNRENMDPLGMSSMSVQSTASNDLINWSKNLRPEDLSPEATLASFFKL